MNLLITSAGRRTKLVEYFKNEFKEYKKKYKQSQKRGEENENLP